MEERRLAWSGYGTFSHGFRRARSSSVLLLPAVLRCRGAGPTSATRVDGYGGRMDGNDSAARG